MLSCFLIRRLRPIAKQSLCTVLVPMFYNILQTLGHFIIHDKRFANKDKPGSAAHEFHVFFKFLCVKGAESVGVNACSFLADANGFYPRFNEFEGRGSVRILLSAYVADFIFCRNHLVSSFGGSGSGIQRNVFFSAIVYLTFISIFTKPIWVCHKSNYWTIMCSFWSR